MIHHKLQKEFTMDKNWKNKNTQPSEDEQKTQIVPRFAQSDDTQIVRPPVSNDATQIVRPPIPNDKTQIVPPPIPNDKTQIVPPFVSNDDSNSIAEGIEIEEDIPKGIEDYPFKPSIPPPNYDEPKRNHTVILPPQPKPVAIEPTPMPQHRVMDGGERNDSIPAFVKWIGGLALLVLLLNLGFCALQSN
jgi:hypothetical protein